ncbi:VOC family protein [Frigidibacter sp. SD6-1]|uniref:VOC family protein n=1 Tax=Frigidibacter sp. SD6-1 TaxID=3032581 RepID=UPI0024DFDB4B|nr:VOC family protein [Frigidibacter sp. SD6-1]
MTRPAQGTPCWYELTTGDLDAAQRFYETVIGWTVAGSGMEGMDYRIAKAGEAMVAGMMLPPAPGIPPNWGIYFAVDDCDAAAKGARADGATVYMEPTDIPDVGRFAALADPQGAAFSILAMDDAGEAFGPMKTGHGNWHELMSSDPKAGLAFYGRLFGWKASTAVDMGPIGTYQLFSHQGQDIGGMMAIAPGMPGPGVPFWLPYFGADGIDAAIGRITANGGTVLNGPMEVPGGAFICVAQDPQGAAFALVGPK